MSTIRADNIGPSDGGTTRSLVRGTAAAWIDFNGTGTVAVRDSENVSSLTDNGSGDYTVNFNSSFTNTNIITQGSASTSSSNPNGIWTSGSGIATTNSRTLRLQNTNGSNLDCEIAQGSFLGDLA